jgi:soluble lytic murein transglycosylase-like protein
VDLDGSTKSGRLTVPRVSWVVWIVLASCRVDGAPRAPTSQAAPPARGELADEPDESTARVDEAPATGRETRGQAREAVHRPAKEVEPPWREQDWPRIAKVQPLVKASAAQHEIDPHLVNAIIWHESKFHPKVTGPGGAAGLMQLMPSTSRALARQLGRPHRPYDVKFNVEVGTYLLARLLKKFDGDERLALAGYGLGSGRVRGLLNAGKPLPDRTERFIAKVGRYREAFAQADAEKAQGSSSR